MLHKCIKCGYKTQYKSNFKKHLQRKTACDKGKKTRSFFDHNFDHFDHFDHFDEAGGNQCNQCKYCKKIYSTKSNLNRHIKNYCKEKEKEKKINLEYEERIVIVESSDDEKEIEILREENKILKKEIEEFRETVEKRLEKVENEPRTTVINNNTQNIYLGPVDLDPSNIKYVFRMYFHEVFVKGPANVIGMLLEMLFENNIRLVDMSREIFQYRLLTGNPEDFENDKSGSVLVKDKNLAKVFYLVKDVWNEEVDKISSRETENAMYKDNTTQRQVDTTRIALEHKKVINNLNAWSRSWVHQVGA